MAVRKIKSRNAAPAEKTPIKVGSVRVVNDQLDRLLDAINAGRYDRNVADTLRNRSFVIDLITSETEVRRYQPVTISNTLEGADFYYYRFAKDGQVLGAGEAGFPDGQFPGITDPALRSGQSVQRFFAELGAHDITCIAANSGTGQAGIIVKPGIVNVINSSFDGIGGRQPDAWFDASIYTPGTTTSNLGFLTGQSAGADNALVIDFNGYAHVAFNNFGTVSQKVYINGDFAFAVKIVFPSTLYSYRNKYARIRPMGNSSRQDVPINKVMDIAYTHTTGGNIDQDYVLYAYRVGGIINAYINDEQVINNVVDNSTAELKLGSNENYACAELIHYNQTLTQAESDGLRNYMLEKYKIGPYA